MKILSPKRINITVAVIVALFQLLILLIAFWGQVESHWQIITISSLSSFVFIYWIMSYLINRFFIQTIKPIYKIIRTAKSTSADIEEDIDELSFTENLQKEVDVWLKEKTHQITRLRAMEQYRKEFIGDVSHELKTPIFTIQGYISTLIDGGLDDPNINMKYLLRTEKSIDRMITIVEDLISISKLESGELMVRKEKFDIALLIREILDLEEKMAQEKSIDLITKFPENQSFMVRADRHLIYQVLINLIVNSINYGKEGGKTSIGLYDMDSLFLVDISDNGIGIKESDIPRIFERFYRVDKSRSKEQGGTGLGLSICKHIVEAHQQNINVSSKLGQGSSFSFTLEKA